MRINKPLKLLTAAVLLVSCSYRSPDVMPCMCEHPDNTLGVFPCICGVNDGSGQKQNTQQQQKVRKVNNDQQVKTVSRQAYANRTQSRAATAPVVEPEQIVVRRKVSKRVAPISRQNAQVLNRRYTEKVYYADEQAVDVYEKLHHLRDDFASLQLAYVDFRLKNANQNFGKEKLGNYRFRIFGCRRESKNVFLNEGRAMEKDMRFFDIFFDTINPVYPVVVDKDDANFRNSDKIKTPEYILTAEITDYFMNICDEYDWGQAKKKKLRTGTSEITITWRLMDLCKQHVYWKGTTTGYGEVNSGEPNGETLLVERAFAEALNNLTYDQGFEKQMLQRVSPEQLMKQQRCFDKTEEDIDSFQCQFKEDLLRLENDYIEYDSPCVSRRYRNSADVRRGHDYRERVREVCRDHRCNNRYEVIEEEIPSDETYELDTSRDIYIDLEDRDDLRLEEDSGFVTLGSAIEQSGGAEATTSLTNMTKTKDDYWVEVPLTEEASEITVENREKTENAAVDGKNKLCIMAQEPYTKMSAENIYRLRKAILGIENANGKKGAGLLVSDQFVLTSADLLNKEANSFKVKMINGKETTASAVRVNPNKNVALLLLDEKISDVRPLSLATGLPEVNKDVYMTLGVSDLEGDIEGALESNGKVTGYRYSPERGAEILVSTSVQEITLGGALADKKGNIIGIAHSGKKSEDGPDLFIPIETALEALDLSICGEVLKVDENSGIKEIVTVTEEVKTEVKKEVKPDGIAAAIDADKTDKAPKPMDGKEKK